MSEQVYPVADGGAVSDGGAAGNGRMLTLLGHLIELRDHAIRIALALVVCSAGTFAFATQVLQWLIRPVSGHEDKIVLVATSPTAAFSMYVKIALFSGGIVAMPFIVYQVLHYVLPAMTPREKRALLWIIPGATLLFAGGALFAYSIMLPPSLSFLFSFWVEFIDQMWTIEEYLGFVTGIVFWVGVSFEMPLLMAAVARLGVVTAKQMLGATRFAAVGIMVLAALITPTPDPLNMALVAGPLLVLYFAGIGLAWLAQPRQAKIGHELHE